LTSRFFLVALALFVCGLRGFVDLFTRSSRTHFGFLAVADTGGQPADLRFVLVAASLSFFRLRGRGNLGASFSGLG